MNDSELRQRFSRQVVLVIADFARDMAEVRALSGLGARVEVAGLGGEPERRELAALGLDTEGVSESRQAVLEAALDRLAATDAVLFGSGDWESEREEVFEAEREQAVADGRSLQPLIAKADERYGFLEAPAEWAVFTLARAAGADWEAAREFARKVDTRTKIVSPEAAIEAARQARAAGKRVKLVTGYFDPLLADHARRLREIADPGSAVFAAVQEPERPILARRARAELVAALAMVDYVTLAGASPSEGSLDGLQPDEVYREEATDERRTRDLILHVQSRHS